MADNGDKRSEGGREREGETSTEGINENNKREMRAGLKERAAKLMKS